MSTRRADREADFEVAVIGGGVPGGTLAAILGAAGLRVALVETPGEVYLQFWLREGDAAVEVSFGEGQPDRGGIALTGKAYGEEDKIKFSYKKHSGQQNKQDTKLKGERRMLMKQVTSSGYPPFPFPVTLYLHCRNGEIQMGEVLVVVNPDDRSALRAAQQQLEDAGGHVAQSYGRHVLIVEAEPEQTKSLAAHPSVLGVYEGKVPEDFFDQLDETSQLGIAAWNERQKASYRAAKKQRKGEGLPWDHPDFEREG